MSNLKKHFFHISKSWFSVCTFIFLLAVCVGLVIHITNKKENATCSNSEAPIVSNGNVSEESGSDIAHAENYVPTEEDVYDSGFYSFSLFMKDLLYINTYIQKM